MDFQNKRVLVLGLAREGVSLVRFLAARGALVSVTDSAPELELVERKRQLSYPSVRFFLGRHHPELVPQADVLFVSPGVPETNPVYQAAVGTGVPIHSMTTLFFDLCPGPILGITGSSGKTTTIGLVGKILEHAGAKFVLGGNIGDPMLDLLPLIDKDTQVVLELSSFQLAILQKSPHVTVVTNISPNHLDRHGTMPEYVAAKRRIVEFQTKGDFAVLNAGDPEVSAFAQSTKGSVRYFGWHVSTGATVRKGHLGLANETFQPVLPIDEVPLLGRHNLENVMAAVAATWTLNIQPEAMASGIRAYKAAPHRLEIVSIQDGVTYIDDSIATSPARASAALEAIEKPILLIAGGREKKLSWKDFAHLVVQRVRSLFLIGEAADLIESEVRRAMTESAGQHRTQGIQRCSSLDDAVRRAAHEARPGEVVLLSPACTSYDMFRDFEQRGDSFRSAVEDLRCGVA